MPILGNAAAWTDALLLGLLAFALRATVLLSAAWAITRALRRASAATRHLIWTSAIAGVLALPLLGVVMPAWNVPLLTAAVQIDAPREAPGPAPVLTPAPARRQDASATLGAAASTTEPTAPLTDAAEPSAPRTIMGTVRDALDRNVSVQSVIVALWLTLAALLLARLAIANARVSSWQRSSRPVEDPRWLTMLLRLSRDYRIERPVVLLENEETDVPVTWGVVYPVVLLPATAQQWDDEQRIAVLTHELAHVKRFDALTQLLAQLALALLWFHPLVWMAVRRMRLEREHACDDFVLVTGARASRYADELLGLARRLTRPTAPAAAALAMARRSELEGRLLAILDPAIKRTVVRRARVGLLTLGAIMLAAPLAAFRPAVRVQTVASSPTIAPVVPEPMAVVAAPAPVAPPAHREDVAAKATLIKDDPQALAALTRRLGALAPTPLSMGLSLSALPGMRPDTEPPKVVDVETLIEVTKAAKRMTSDHEKGQLLALIAKRYQRSDALRDAYLETVFTMTSDHERSQALLALLDKDSLPLSAVAQVLRSTALMTSDVNKGMVLKRISPAVFADTAVQRAYLEAIVAMTSDVERGAAITSLVKQRPLAPAVQLAVLQLTVAISSNVEKSNVLLLFLDRQGLADDRVRRAFFKAAESLTSDTDYRRLMTAVMK